MSILYNGARMSYLRTSILDPIVTQEAGNSAVHVMSQKAATASFANALKGRASGQVVTLDDVTSLPAKVKVTVESKNLVKYPYYGIAASGTTIINGVTFKDNGDGSITANGKATSDTALLLSLDKYYGNKSAHGLSADGPATDTKNGYTFRDCDYYYSSREVVIYIGPGTVVKNRIYYPQIERGEVATDFVSPLAAGAAVHVTTRGDNLIPYPFYEGTTSKSGLTFTDDGQGRVTVNGTATAKVYYLLVDTANELRVLPTEARLEGCPPGGSDSSKYHLVISDNDKAGHYYKADYGSGVALEKGFTYNQIYLVFVKGCTANNLVFEPRLVLGTNAGETKETAIGESIELDSIASNMHITSDDVGACLLVEYNKDPNIVIDKLTQAIISLGGNI